MHPCGTWWEAFRRWVAEIWALQEDCLCRCAWLCRGLCHATCILREFLQENSLGVARLPAHSWEWALAKWLTPSHSLLSSDVLCCSSWLPTQCLFQVERSWHHLGAAWEIGWWSPNAYFLVFWLNTRAFLPYALLWENQGVMLESATSYIWSNLTFRSERKKSIGDFQLALLFVLCLNWICSTGISFISEVLNVR